MSKTMTLLLCAVLGAASLAGCGGGKQPAKDTPAPPPLGADGKPRVFVSIAPMATFAEKIGGDQVHVELLVEPGRSPATFQPSPQQMVRLGEAQAFFRIGVPFEKAFLPKLRDAYPGLRIVDTRQGVEMIGIAEGGACCSTEGHDPVEHDHDHGDHDEHADHGHAHEGHDHAGHDDGHHHHGAHDPHIWTSTANAKIVARTMAKALSEIAPRHKDLYAKNLAAYEAELDATDRKLAEMLAPVKGRRLYVYHPAFGYFAKRYGLQQTSVERDGKSPSARHVDGLVTVMKAEGVKALFVQPQFSKTSMEGLAKAIGAEVVVLDPLARDYCGNLLKMGEAIARGLGAEAAQTPAAEAAAE